MRLGHPARVMPELRAHTLDLLVERHDDVRAGPQAGERRPGPVSPRRAHHAGQARAGRAPRDASRSQDCCWPTRGASRPRPSSNSGYGRRAVRDDDRLGRRPAGRPAVRPGRDRRSLPEHRARLLDSAARARAAWCWPATIASCRPRSSATRPSGKASAISLFERLADMHRPASWLAAAGRAISHAPRRSWSFPRGEFYEAGLDRRRGGRRTHLLAELPDVDERR